ncbi:hypothetical protein [Clostridium sp. DL1XJH146]
MKKAKEHILFLIMVICLSIVFTGCSNNENNDSQKKSNETVEADMQEEESQDVEKEQPEEMKESKGDVITLDDEIINGAKEEGISEEEMLRIITELTELDAEKYGSSVEEYLPVLADQGLTPYSAQKQISEVMGISIKEVYEYGKTVDDMGLDDDRDEYLKPAEILEEIDATGMLQGEATNEVSGDAKELLLYKVRDIETIEEFGDDTEAFYYSEEDYDELVDYFTNLLEGTETYFVMKADVATTIIGTIDGKEVTVAVHNLLKYDPSYKANGVTVNY